MFCSDVVSIKLYSDSFGWMCIHIEGTVLEFVLCWVSTGCSLDIAFFPQNVVIFLNYASSAAALVFYLPGVCTHTDTEEKQRKARVRNILKFCIF